MIEYNTIAFSNLFHSVIVSTVCNLNLNHLTRLVNSEQAKTTTYDKVDKLIDILGRRPDAVFEVFCELVKIENSDLFHLLNSSEGKAVVTYQILNRPDVFCLKKSSTVPNIIIDQIS